MPRQHKKKPAAKRAQWTMPDWMEPYRQYIANTGGNSIESMMNGDADPLINLPLSTLQACVKSQISLLYVMHDKGMLPEGDKLLQGFALAVVALVDDDQPSMAGAIMRSYGITLAQMIEAQVDKSDLKTIRKAGL